LIDLPDPGSIPRHFARIGGEHRRITRGVLRSAVNDRTYASFVLDLRHLAAVDLTPPVKLVVPGPGGDPTADDAIPSFTGHVVMARPDSDGLAIEAEGGRGLVESSVGLLQTSGVTPEETIHLVGQLGGVSIQGLEAVGLASAAMEVIMVEMPVVGVAVERVVAGSEVDFLPLAEPGGELEFGPFTQIIDDLTSRWGRPTARARTYVAARLMYEAEVQGIDRIERALDALLATATYGLSRDPWGRSLPFDRAQLRARPAAIPIVFTQGVATGRRWLHALAGTPIETHLDVGASFERWSELLSGRPSDEVVRAMRALRDAADETRDVFDRCHALCTVLEYYAASSKPEHIVSKAVKKRALHSLKELDMTEIERKRLREVIEGVNNPPLLARVRHQAHMDGAPFSDAERGLVAKLRAARNDTVHGRGRASEIPDADDLQWGVSVVSRLLLYRWVSESEPALNAR
jgi:hypothetical protein